MDRLTINLVQDLQRAGQCGRFHPGRSEIQKTLFVSNFQTLIQQVGRIDNTGQTLQVGWLSEYIFSDCHWHCSNKQSVDVDILRLQIQGVRYTAVEGEVDEARITEILNRLKIFFFWSDTNQTFSYLAIWDSCDFNFYFPDTLERGRCSPKVPACAIEQQASEVRMLAYRNKCLHLLVFVC